MNPIRFFRKMKLRVKFVLSISALLIATITLLSTYLSNKQEETYMREMENSSRNMIRMMALNSEDGLTFENEYILQDVLDNINEFDNVTFAAIYNNDKIMLASVGSWTDSGKSVTSHLDSTTLEDTNCTGFYCKDKNGNEYITIQYPVLTVYESLSRENLGLTGGIDTTLTNSKIIEEIGTIELTLSLNQVKKDIAESRNAAVLLTVIATLIAVVVLMLFIRVITDPISKVVEATDRITQGDLSQYVQVKQEDEIGQLATTFNLMVASLNKSRVEIEEYNRNLEEKIIERTMELEEAQAQLVQSEKLSAIGQLAAGVAHELNNPLGGILGYAQFTLEKLKRVELENMTAKDISNYIKYLTDIEIQSRRCKNIVQNLLRFSRSSKTTEFIEVNVNDIIEDTCTFIEHQLHMNQISLIKNLDIDIPAIQGNPGQLQQVITNLILNAMHASPPDTEIDITTHFSHSLGEFDGSVEIICSDQGKGIPKENINKIFEPFFTTKEVGKGTGLGLSVSYGIIKEHGGEIKVDSNINNGTTFTIILPLQKLPVMSDKLNDEFNFNISDDLE